MQHLRKGLLLMALGAMSLAACSTYHMEYKNPATVRGEKHALTQKFFLWGLVGGADIDLKQLCPSGVADITSETSFVDALFFGFTGGLYSPTSVEVYCKGGVAYRVERTEDDVSVTSVEPSPHLNES